MFKDKLIELRKINKDSQESLAEKLHVSRSLVAKWEQNRSYPNEEDLEELIIIYNVKLEDLVSARELKTIYGKTLKSNKIKSIWIVILSLISVFSICLAIGFSLININDGLIEENPLNETITLNNYVGNSSNDKTSLVYIDNNSKLIYKNKYGYSYGSLSIYKNQFTDVSCLLEIVYKVEVTPGKVAYLNDHKEFDSNSILNSIKIQISVDNVENIKLLDGIPYYGEYNRNFKSQYSNNYILNEFNKGYMNITTLKDGINLRYSNNDYENLVNNYQNEKVNSLHRNLKLNENLFSGLLMMMSKEKKNVTNSFVVCSLYEIKDSEIENFITKIELFDCFKTKNIEKKVSNYIEYFVNF